MVILRPPRLHVEKLKVWANKLDGSIRAKVTLILGFDAPLEEDRKSKFEDRRLMLEDSLLGSADCRFVTRCLDARPLRLSVD